MRFTIKVHGQDHGVTIQPMAGRVMMAGLPILPFEAAMLADALNRCAERAETMAAEAAAALQPAEA